MTHHMIKVLWNTYKSHNLWPFSIPCSIWPLMKLKGQIKVIGFLVGYISLTKHVLAIVYYIGSHLCTISLPQDIWPWITFQVKVTWVSKGISYMEHLIKFCVKRLYNKSYMVFQFTPWHLTLGGIERSNQGHWMFNQLHWALYHRPCIIRQRSSQAERPLVFFFFLSLDLVESL